MGNADDGATNIDSCDTLFDVDMNFKEMRTCDGPCKEIICLDDLEIFECRHAICGSCLNEMTSIEIPNGKYLCPVAFCRHASALRNSTAVKEYAYLKKYFLRTLLFTSSLTDSSTLHQPSEGTLERSISIENLIFPSQRYSQSGFDDDSNEEDATTSAMTSSSEEEGIPQNISGITLVSKNNIPRASCSDMIDTSPDFYSNEDNDISGPLTNPLYAVTMSEYVTAKNTMKQHHHPRSPYPLNIDEYDESLVSELQALSCATAINYLFDDFDDCTTAKQISYPLQS